MYARVFAHRSMQIDTVVGQIMHRLIVKEVSRQIVHALREISRVQLLYGYF